MNNRFPKLKIIPLNKLILHEKEEPKRVENLIKRVRIDGYFKNPVIAAELCQSCSKFLVLDGVHRVKALEKLGCFVIVAQIVDYFDRNIKVCTWDHLLFGCSQKELLEKIQQTGNLNLIKATEKDAQILLKKKEIIGYLHFKNGEIFLLNNKSNSDFEERTEKLLALMALCGKIAEVSRVIKSDTSCLFKSRRDATAVLVIPNYTKKEILKVAQSGAVLPAGVTRHIVPNRVLGLDVDLAILRSKSPLALKNKLLKKFIDQRMKDKRIRFYSESVFIFDE